MNVAVLVGTLAVATTTIGCQLGRAGAITNPVVAAQWSRDSAKYVQDSIKWVHDSVVVDSISRRVNTDSLYHLIRGQLHADNPVPMQRAIDCEMARLSWVHGANATADAFDRMRDTLFRPSDKADKKRVDIRLSGMSVDEMGALGVGQRQCGRFSLWGPRHPLVFDGASLDTRTGRPARPRRPES